MYVKDILIKSPTLLDQLSSVKIVGKPLVTLFGLQSDEKQNFRIIKSVFSFPLNNLYVLWFENDLEIWKISPILENDTPKFLGKFTVTLVVDVAFSLTDVCFVAEAEGYDKFTISKRFLYEKSPTSCSRSFSGNIERLKILSSSNLLVMALTNGELRVAAMDNLNVVFKWLYGLPNTSVTFDTSNRWVAMEVRYDKKPWYSYIWSAENDEKSKSIYDAAGSEVDNASDAMRLAISGIYNVGKLGWEYMKDSGGNAGSEGRSSQQDYGGGCVEIVDFHESASKIVPVTISKFYAHKDKLAMLKFSRSGLRLASADVNGQVIHIHSVCHSGVYKDFPRNKTNRSKFGVKLLYKLERGLSLASISDISFDETDETVIFATTHGTIHFFSLPYGSTGTKYEALSDRKWSESSINVEELSGLEKGNDVGTKRALVVQSSNRVYVPERWNTIPKTGDVAVVRSQSRAILGNNIESNAIPPAQTSSSMSAASSKYLTGAESNKLYAKSLDSGMAIPDPSPSAAHKRKIFTCISGIYREKASVVGHVTLAVTSDGCVSRYSSYRKSEQFENEETQEKKTVTTYFSDLKEINRWDFATPCTEAGESQFERKSDKIDASEPRINWIGKCCAFDTKECDFGPDDIPLWKRTQCSLNVKKNQREYSSSSKLNVNPQAGASDDSVSSKKKNKKKNANIENDVIEPRVSLIEPCSGLPSLGDCSYHDWILFRDRVVIEPIKSQGSVTSSGAGSLDSYSSDESNAHAILSAIGNSNEESKNISSLALDEQKRVFLAKKAELKQMRMKGDGAANDTLEMFDMDDWIELQHK